MAILVGSGKRLTTDDGIPYMWQSGDVTTAPNEVGIITASDGGAAGAYFYFGRSVAVGSGKIVVGGPLANVNSNISQGAAYIYDLDGTNEIKITASDGAGSDAFGHSVAVGSGKIVVGAYSVDIGSNANQGAAYIYDLDGTNEIKITASDGAANDVFGISVAVGCGKIVVGAYGNSINGSNSGSAYIFDLDGNQLGIITASDGAANDYFGISVAVGCGKIVVGAYGDDIGSNASQGAAYIYDLDGTNEVKITASDGAASDNFGRSVAVGSGRIVVGAYFDDFDDSFNNNNEGSAYIFDLDGNLIKKITASDGAIGDTFGGSVAVGNGRIVVGVTGDDDNGSSSGSAYIYDLDGNQLGIITASDGAADDFFGASVAVGSGIIVVGAESVTIGSNYQHGAAYIYDTPPVYNLYDAIDLNYG
jgi:hypothetical protein